jgi:hypothetical protein
MCSLGAVAFNLSGSSNRFDVFAAKRIETVFLASIQYFTGISPELAGRKLEYARGRFTELFFPLVFTLGDTQLITGLGVLISGWIRLRAGLPVYHFTVIADLAWMASDTQLIAFFALFQCVRASSQQRRTLPDIQPYVFLPSRLCRAFGMLCMCGMLLVASVIISDRSWWDCVSRPAVDFFSHLSPGGVRLRWAIFNYSMLAWGYGAALIPLFGPTYRAYEAIKCALHCGGAWPPRVRWVLSLGAEALDSMIFDTAFCAAWFGLGVWNIISDRSQGASDIRLCSVDNAEAEWGFGQLVPMVLLGLPLLGALDVYGKHTESGGGATLPHLWPAHSGSQMDLVGPGSPTSMSFASADLDTPYNELPPLAAVLPTLPYAAQSH